MQTYGIIAGSRISGSRMPLFFLVALALTQSESGSSGRQTNQGANENCKIEEANILRAVAVWRIGKVLCLGQVDREERAAAPRHDEGRELDDGEGEQLPRDPQVHEDRLERMCVCLVELPLLLAWCAPSKPRITFRSSLMAQRINICIDRGGLRVTGLLVFNRLRGVCDLLLRATWWRTFRVRSDVLQDLIGVEAMPFGLGKQEDDRQEGRADHGCVQPPEAAPPNV